MTLVVAMNAKMSWYVARASGMVAWAVVTASILWGLALSTRLIRRKGAPAWLLDLHKFLGTLSVVFVVVHLLALWADSFVHFGPRELFVPMASNWRPGAVAWGIVATYMLVAIQLSSWAMRKMKRRVWHTIHLTSFAMFGAATIHGFTAGADNTNLLVQWTALTGGLLVFFLVTFRLLAPRRAARVAGAKKKETASSSAGGTPRSAANRATRRDTPARATTAGRR